MIFSKFENVLDIQTLFPKGEVSEQKYVGQHIKNVDGSSTFSFYNTII